MADPLHSPPSPPPPDPKPFTPTAGKSSPNKRKITTATSSLANKRPNKDPPSSTTTGDDEDTATSKRKEILQDVDIEDIEVMESLLDYHSRKGVFPFENPTDMKSFLRPWLLLHIGNVAGWKTKLEKVKTKFNKASAPVEDGERKEFELWMKIWRNQDPSGGS